MRTTSRTLVTVVFISLSIGLIALALGGYLSPLSRIILDPLTKAQTWLYTRYQAIQSYVTAPADVASLRQRNAELEAEIARLQVQVIELQQQVTEAQVFSTLVDYKRTRPDSRHIAARVIGFDTSPFMRYVFIDQGTESGLRVGMPVVTHQGLIGQIAAVTPVSARVQLITDADSSVNIHLQQSGAEAVLLGHINGEITLDLIPQDVNVQPGEIVLTSGLGGNYPPNLIVGQVSTVRRRDYDLFQTASVQPAVDFSQLEFVLVIVNFQPIDITPLIPTPSIP